METFVADLVAAGVRAACISPGSRSSPLALTLGARDDIDCHVVLDERSSAFMALGIAKASRRPVAVVCTSGTAAANFHPAVCEADLSRVPLLVLTCDRPPELHARGAEQTIDQHGLYGTSVREFIDAGIAGDSSEILHWFAHVARRAVDRCRGPVPGPVHVNISFREPLVERRPGTGSPLGPNVTRLPGAEPDTSDVERLATELAGTACGIIVAGSMPDAHDPQLQDAVAGLAGVLDWPLVADATSGLRYGGPAAAHCIDHVDLLARHDRTLDILAPDTVLRIGGWPISKPIAALCSRADRHVHIDQWAWSDPQDQVTETVRARPAPTLAALRHAIETRGIEIATPKSWLWRWEDAARRVSAALHEYFCESSELSEASVAAICVENTPPGSALCVGASMPLRDIDVFAAAGEHRIDVYSNRGANGIDGFVSTCAGIAAAHDGPVLAICGDLTLAHDAAALELTTREALAVTFVVPNNIGGGIFSFLPQARLGLGADFDRFLGVRGAPTPSAVARAAGVEHKAVARPGDLTRAVSESSLRETPLVVEVPSDAGENVSVHEAVWSATGIALDDFEGAQFE